MNLRAIRADAVYKVRAWTRMRGSMVISLLLPIILLLALGLIFNATPSPRATLHVVDQDHGAASAELLANLASSPAVTLRQGGVPQGADPATIVRQEGLAVLVTVPPGFGDDMAAGRPANLTVVVNTGQPFAARVGTDALHAALAELAGDARMGLSSVSVPAPPYAAFLLPGIIGLNVLSVGLFSSFLSVVELRHQGLLQRLAVSPMTKTEWLVARMLGQAAISLSLMAFLVAVAWLVFHVPLVLSPWPLLLVLLGTLLFAGLGVILGARVKQAQTGASVINLVILPVSLLSGSFFDVDLLPRYLGWFAKVSPLTYLNQGLRASLVASDTAGAAQAALVLGALSVAVLLVGGRLIKWTDA